MKIKKSIQLWDHVPSLDELRARCVPSVDITSAEFADGTDLTIYFRCTGLTISTNGKDKYKSEMKYGIDDFGEAHFPEYQLPKRSEFLLI